MCGRAAVRATRRRGGTWPRSVVLPWLVVSERSARSLESSLYTDLGFESGDVRRSEARVADAMVR